jgi:hypothetical protein
MGRPTVLERVQVAPEVTPGTAVAANKRLMAYKLKPTNKVGVKRIDGVGSKIPIGTVIGKEFVQAGIEGPLSYTDIVYLLSAHLATGTVAGQAWTFDLQPFAADTIKTLSVEAGSAGRAEKWAYSFVPDLQMRFTTTECTLSGQMIGRPITEGITITAGPTVIPCIAVGPKDWKVQVGDAVGSLVDVPGVLEADFVSRNRFKAQMFADGTNTFDSPYEMDSQMQMHLTGEHGAILAGFMSDLRSAKRRFVRILATGAQFTVAMVNFNYALQITMPFTFNDDDRDDHEGVWGSTWVLEPEYESTVTYGVDIVVTSSVVAL